MDKLQAQEQIKKLEEDLAKLKAIVEAPEKAGSLLEVPEKGTRIFSITYNSGGFQACRVASGLNVIIGCNSFVSGDVAKAYAEAFETLLMLRQCEGAEPVVEDLLQYFIEGDGNVSTWATHEYKLMIASPAFKSEEFAQKAVDKIGKERIIRMYKTFQHVGE